MSENQEYQPLVDTLCPPPSLPRLTTVWSCLCGRWITLSSPTSTYLSVFTTHREGLSIYLSINLSFESLGCELLPIYQSVFLKVLDERCYLLIHLLGGVFHVPICLYESFGLVCLEAVRFCKMCVYLMCLGACVRVLLQMQACY